jgi:hypothetical protein
MERWRGEIALRSSSNTWKLLSPFISFLICHWPQQQQKASNNKGGEGGEMCVCLCVCVCVCVKNTLLTSVGPLCFVSIFHPILMTKWVLSNVCYQFDPKHTFIHFPLAPFFWSIRLYLSKERRGWCRRPAVAGNYQWTNSHSSLLPIFMRHCVIKKLEATRKIRVTVISGVKLFSSIHILQNTTFSEKNGNWEFLSEKMFW